MSSKYYNKTEFPSHSAQVEFENRLLKKTKATTAIDTDVLSVDNFIAIMRPGVDVSIYVVGADTENELILTTVLYSFYDALSALLRGQLDRRTLLDNLALVLLTMDELIDGGKILEIDPSAIANRVLMRGGEGGPQGGVSELTIQQAIAVAREEFIRRMGN